MITITPAVQLSAIDSGTTPSTNLPVVPSGLGVVCPAGMLVQDAILAEDTEDEPLPFPIGVDEALVIYIVAVTATDLVINVGGTPVALDLPLGQPFFLYNMPDDEVTISSALGGKIQYAIGG